MLFIEYPKCSTCRNAKKWLDDKGIEYTDRHIVENRPTFDELKSWHEKSGMDIKRFFNTSGMKYRELDLKHKLPNMSEDDMLGILSSDAMLVGFKEKEWNEKLDLK